MLYVAAKFNLGTRLMSKESVYTGSSIILTTKHFKSQAIAPCFLSKLSAKVEEYVVDTDKLGTFSGEIERVGTALECAKSKCELGMNETGSLYGLSSEGSFGPHPFAAFLACNQEILYFIDRKRDFHLYVSCLSNKTNYKMQNISTMEELAQFAQNSLFPSHGLIVRPNQSEKSVIFKGINTISALNAAFKESMKYSDNGKVWVETDMRAHMNPSRMSVIKALAEELATRLSVLCANCENPGWGKVDVEKGLECSSCGSETEAIKAEIYGCVKCDHKEKRLPLHNLRKADPGNCAFCNP